MGELHIVRVNVSRDAAIILNFIIKKLVNIKSSMFF